MVTREMMLLPLRKSSLYLSKLNIGSNPLFPQLLFPAPSLFSRFCHLSTWRLRSAILCFSSSLAFLSLFFLLLMLFNRKALLDDFNVIIDQ